LQIGGSNFLRKATVLHLLASHCDGLFLVGKLSFQIMNGLGIPVPSCLLERNATKEVLQLIQIAHNRNIPIYYPTDLWCLNSNNNETLEIFDSSELFSGEFDQALVIYVCLCCSNTHLFFLGNACTIRSFD
jgi:phosphoglycerate kinase